MKDTTIIKIIQLPNRYHGIKNSLEFIEEKDNLLYYKLVIPDAETDWMRVIADDTGSFETPSAIDPSGGPYMSVGHYNIEHILLVKIINLPNTPITLVFEKQKS